MGRSNVLAHAQIVRARLVPEALAAGALATSPGAAAFLEFDHAFGIASITGSLETPITSGVPATTGIVSIELLVQYFSGAVYSVSGDSYSGGSWTTLLSHIAVFNQDTIYSADQINLDFGAPLRPPLDLMQSIPTQMRDPTNNLVTNQQRNHFMTPNMHRHTYSGGITADDSGAAKPWVGHRDFRIWARQQTAVVASTTYALDLTLGLV